MDFNEDTQSGKHTLHGTAMAIYQRRNPEDVMTRLDLSSSTQERSIKDLPDVNLLQCRIPKSPKPPSPAYPNFKLSEEKEPLEYISDDLVWLLGQVICGPAFPKWSGYNSMLSKGLPLTSWHVPPLIAQPAHEWQTLLTVLKQAQHISAQVVGPQRKTVITLDMG